MILNTTYFDGGELNIPGTEQDPIADVLNDIISMYEPDYLQRALGYPLWKLFNAAINPGPAPVGRFKDLLDGGVEYTDQNGHLKLYAGLKTKFTTPIAMYVWYWWQVKNASYSSSQGEQKGKTENAGNVSVAQKQVQQWNKMNSITKDLWEYLKYSKNGDGTAKYPEFDLCQVKPFGVLNTSNL